MYGAGRFKTYFAGKSPLLFCAALLSILAASSMHSFAQLPRPDSNLLDLAPEFLTQKISEHSRVYHHDQGLESIPKPMIYRSAFLSLLLNAAYVRSDFTDDDWEIITSLPEHTDRQFIEISHANLQATCALVKNMGRGNAKSAVRNLAILAKETESRNMQNLENHYGIVMDKLSEQGRNRVETQISILPSISTFSWSEMDLVGLTDDVPEYVEDVLLGACENQIQMSPHTMQSRLLIDTPRSWMLLEDNTN